MAMTQVILLERVDKLGAMGDVVAVKPGYARNFLLPQKKALRANKENVAYFDAQRKYLEGENAKKRSDAEKLSDKLKGLKVPLIRQASEGGQLYGSVTSRDIADHVSAASGLAIERSMIVINQNFKTIGLFEVPVALHAEVKVMVTVNIARSAEEAKIQAETGKALTSDSKAKDDDAVANDAQLEDVLEQTALVAEKAKKVEAAERAAEDEIKAAASAEKAAKKAAKKAKDAEADAEEPTAIG
jgi:large subunit ribosomal protein L9